LPNPEEIMNKLACALVLGALLGVAATLNGHGQEPKKKGADKPDPKRVQALMRRKLDNSQKLLEALILNDLAKAAQHADELQKISKEAEWNVFKTRDYEVFSDDFRHNLTALRKAAKDKNLEGAKLNYLGLTMGCFNCHSYVRDQGMALADIAGGLARNGAKK
jgi:hypothetical protein